MSRKGSGVSKILVPEKLWCQKRFWCQQNPGTRKVLVPESPAQLRFLGEIREVIMLRRITVLGITSVSQNRYSAAPDPFLEFAVHLGVYGKVCLGPPF